MGSVDGTNKKIKGDLSHNEYVYLGYNEKMSNWPMLGAWSGFAKSWRCFDTCFGNVHCTIIYKVASIIRTHYKHMMFNRDFLI